MKHIFLLLLLFSFSANAYQDYSRNVVRKKNEVFLRGFRPQLQKGETCSFYSTSMILNYYGKNTSARKLQKGTNHKKGSWAISKELESLGFIYQYTRAKSFLLFRDTIKFAIDHGIPLRWDCNMKRSPIRQERKGTYHARIILGYVGKKQVTHVIYADSWGMQHLHKIMNIRCAYNMTTLYGPIYPQGSSEEIIEGFQNLTDKEKPQIPSERNIDL